MEQIKKFKPKYFIINDFLVFNKVNKNNIKNLNVKIYNRFSDFKIKNVKFDITISAIVGIAGLEPTLKFTKISKKKFY